MASPFSECPLPFNTCTDGQGTSLHFVSHFADRIWGWSYKHHPRICAGLGKVRPLGEETVAWVDSIHIVVLRSKRRIYGEKRLFTFITQYFCALYLLA